MNVRYGRKSFLIVVAISLIAIVALFWIPWLQEPCDPLLTLGRAPDYFRCVMESRK